MEKLGLKNDIDGLDGYSTKLKLSVDETACIAKIIEQEWLTRINEISPDAVDSFSKIGMTRYHENSDRLEHSAVWTKISRVISTEHASIIKSLPFFKKLRNEFGDFTISDEEHIGRENIYWRLVRPGNHDFGSIHADRWFWEIGGYGKVADFPHRRLKIWIAIHTVVGKNGLYVVPRSHQRHDWKWHSEVKYGLNKPIIDEKEDDLDLVLLPLGAGETVVFHDDLLHGGAPNLADTTRVSMEFTLLIPNHASLLVDSKNDRSMDNAASL